MRTLDVQETATIKRPWPVQSVQAATISLILIVLRIDSKVFVLESPFRAVGVGFRGATNVPLIITS